jgi:type II secretory pathway component PulC
LISQDRRLAIIGERILAVGDPLPGVGRVEAIEPDRVIISRNGRREILRLVPETLNR